MMATVARARAARGVRRLGSGVVGVAAVGAAARRLAAARGHGLVLVYHRVNEGRGPDTVVPSVSPAVLRRQVEALMEVGRVVPLAELVEARGRPGALRFSLTFDDDYASHVREVLPTLTALRVPATFFLSGRTLHGLGPYWWESLEEVVKVRGLEEAARLIGVPPYGGVAGLALACERDPRRQQLAQRATEASARHLSGGDIRALADAGMTIGFHTLHHPVLTRLPEADVGPALTVGRAELEQASGQRLRFFAYPHGKADGGTAWHVHRAGYAAAWTGQPRPVRRGDPLHLLGRWEPGSLGVDAFLAKIAVRLNRAAPIRGGGPP
jgi:peptidoglycan/xylan/chitin deacetylase (PgdA/CDA1 family)